MCRVVWINALWITDCLQGTVFGWCWQDIENAWRSYCPQGVYSITRKLKVKLLSNVRLFVTPWAVAYQAPLSMGFSRQEYWSGLPFPSPGDLPDPGIEPGSPALQADTWPSELQGRSIIRGGNKNLWHIVYTCHTFIHLSPGGHVGCSVAY